MAVTCGQGWGGGGWWVVGGAGGWVMVLREFDKVVLGEWSCAGKIMLAVGCV
jgi:hypothetical protein